MYPDTCFWPLLQPKWAPSLIRKQDWAKAELETGKSDLSIE